MKRSSRVPLVVLLCIVTIAGASCGRGSGDHDRTAPAGAGREGGRTADGAAEGATDARDDAPGDGTIFDLDVELVDHDGRRVRIDALRGQTTVAAMIYTSCTAVCPTVTQEMIAIERQLAASDADVRLALFSLDPARDTPAALRTFAAERRLDLRRWTLMATSEDGVRNLAAVLGVKYRPEANGEFAHSALIAVIDRHGVIRHRQVGTGQDASELLAVVRRLGR